MKNWHRMARLAEEKLQATREGKLMERQARVASELGTSPQNLRNTLEAYRFMVDVADADTELANTLSGMSVTAVNGYARWYRHDPYEAFIHLRKIGDDPLPVRDLLRLVRSRTGRSMPEASRQLSGKGPSPAIAHALTRAGLPAIPARELAFDRPSDRFAAVAGVSEVLRWHHREDSGGAIDREVAGIIRVTESNVPQMYSRNAKPTLARAVTASVLYPVVLVILPDAASLSIFNSALPPLPEKGRKTDPAASKQEGMALAPCLGTIFLHAWGTVDSIWCGSDLG